MTRRPTSSTLFPYTTLFRSTAYINTVGRGLDQVLLERRLRETLERYLDEHRDELAGRPPLEIRERIQEFVAAVPELRPRSEEHTSELQSQFHLVCRLLLEKK